MFTSAFTALACLAAIGVTLIAVFVRRDQGGFSSLDRLWFKISTTALWARLAGSPLFGSPLLKGAFAILVLAVGGFGVVEFASGGSEAPAEPLVFVRPTPSPTAIVLPSPAPPQAPLQALDGPVDITVWRQSDFAWPAEGRIAGLFGAEGGAGLTIALDPKQDSLVRASARGVVASVGPGDCCEDGNYVAVDHGNGIRSLYGPLAEVRVAIGDRVEQGDVLGVGGSPTNASSNLLHFELQVAGDPVDPLRYLPSTAFGGGDASPQSLACPSDPIALDPASSVTLAFASDGLGAYAVQQAEVVPGDSSAPVITAHPRGFADVTLDVAPATSAPQRSALNLRVIFARGDARILITCDLIVSTADGVPSMPKPTPQPADDTATPVPVATEKPSPTKVPSPTVTATKVKPTATATKPRQSPTASKTPLRGIHPTPAPTSRPGGH